MPQKQQREYLGRWVAEGAALDQLKAATDELSSGAFEEFKRAESPPGLTYVAREQLFLPGRSRVPNQNARPVAGMEDVRVELLKAYPTAEQSLTLHGKPVAFVNKAKLVAALQLLDPVSGGNSSVVAEESSFVRTHYAADIVRREGELVPPVLPCVVLGKMATSKDVLPTLRSLLDGIPLIPLSSVGCVSIEDYTER